MATDQNLYEGEDDEPRFYASAFNFYEGIVGGNIKNYVDQDDCPTTKENGETTGN